MNTRRTFLQSATAACLLAALPAASACTTTIEASEPMKTTDPKTACVLWYSQTGNTRRVGTAIAAALRAAGLEVQSSDYREARAIDLASFDLVVLGSPVFFGDVPVNLRWWLEGPPDLGGTPVATFATFGGPGDGQEHTAAAVLGLLAARGGAPVGTGTFGCMSVFAPTWSLGNSKRTLAYKHLPSAETYEAARSFARDLLARTRSGQSVVVKRSFGKDSLMRALPTVSLNKLLISNHGVDTERCIGCGTCVKLCPADAIDPEAGTVSRRRCLSCLGCLNNCPVGAVTMSYTGKPVYGFREFLERHEITILEPEA
jgi:ferredoxin/flavodoxin